MSGRTSLSTRTGTYSLLTTSMTPWAEYVVSSITRHQWHHTAEIESRMGRPWAWASSNASADQGRQLISCARFARGEKWNSRWGSPLIVLSLRARCRREARLRPRPSRRPRAPRPRAPPPGQPAQPAAVVERVLGVPLGVPALDDDRTGAQRGQVARRRLPLLPCPDLPPQQHLRLGQVRRQHGG